MSVGNEIGVRGVEVQMSCSGNSSHLQLSSRVRQLLKRVLCCMCQKVMFTSTLLPAAVSKCGTTRRPGHQHYQPSQLSRPTLAVVLMWHTSIWYICALWHATSDSCLLFYAFSFWRFFFTNFRFAAVFRFLYSSAFKFFTFFRDLCAFTIHTTQSVVKRKTSSNFEGNRFEQVNNL